MAINYTKKTWAKGDYVTPTPLNNIENALKSACDAVDTINSKVVNEFSATATDWQGAIIELARALSTKQIFTGYVTYGDNGIFVTGQHVTASTWRFLVLMRGSTRVFSCRLSDANSLTYKELTGGSDTVYP